MSRVTLFRGLLCTLVLAAMAAPLPAPAQTDSLYYGRLGVDAPERTDAGDWYGTWYFTSRTRKMALWIRDTDGTPEVKFRLADRGENRQSFSTDWDTRATYDASGQTGEFALEFENRDENTMSGRWTWRIRSTGGTSDETARFTIYRSGYGRQLVLQFTDLTRKETHGAVREFPELVWSFRKASRREVLWIELPF